ncbi:MAG: diguanylate cyclase [Oscillospiraceae bacterium]
MGKKSDTKTHKGSSGLTAKIVSLAVIPLLLLSLIASFLIAMAIYENFNKEVYNELRSECVTINSFISRKISSDIYSGEVMKEDLFDSIAASNDMDITLFSGAERIITTVRQPDGSRAVGTYASPEVISEVLDKKSDFFSRAADINGEIYYGYYMPLSDSDGNVIGMTFAGKNRQSVIGSITVSILGTLAVSWLLTAVVAVVCVSMAGRMVQSLAVTADFLGRISEGDTDCVPDERMLSRSDEVGDMGRAAVKLQTSLRELISNDPLTGLLNRRACNIKLAEMLDSANADDAGLTVVIGDIDLFKIFNDRYGHACGDLVLKEVSAILAEETKGCGIASRWGGEEFLLAFALPRDEAMAALGRIMERIRGFRGEYDGEEISVSMTFGVQHFSGEGNTDVLVNSADAKLYYGKNHGRNRIVEYIPAENAAE